MSRINYVAGNTSRRDHGNWPTILRSEIETYIGALSDDQKDEFWPVDISLLQLMALSWRVKRWRLNGSVSVTKDIPANTASATADATITDADIWILKEGDEACVTESDIVGKVSPTAFKALINNGIGPEDGDAPVSDWSQTFNSNPYSSGSTPVSGVGALALNILSPNGFELYDPGTHLFMPSFFGLGIVAPGGSNPLSVSVAFTRNPIAALSGTTPFIAKTPIVMTISSGIADAFDVPMQLAWRFVSEGTGNPTTGTGAGSFTLEAVEFWSYDGTWDTGSGAQLLDPFR